MNKILIGLFISLSCMIAKAEELPFPSVWNQINSGSAAQEASKLQTEAIAESKARASRHWLPKLYLDIKSYQTNDPGSSFFGLLEQRSLLQTDFNPDAINHPDSHIYTRGAIGVDVPLYEGGMKSSQVEALTSALQAQKNAKSQVQLEQYAQVSFAYAAIAITKKQQDKITELGTQIERLLKNYQLGNKSNPVGYSGLLGMKSLSNRLSGLKNQYDAQSKSYFIMLKELGLKNEGWSPDQKSTITFVDQYLPVTNQNANLQSSYKVESLKENAKSNEHAITIEAAKNLPRVGAFAEGQLFNGNKDTANSYMAGVYLQWNLFDSSTYGAEKEARLKAQSIAKSAQALEQQERSERMALIESMTATRRNIELLEDSYKILLEQSKITETLFKNGSINALQFVEVLSRRADLITQQGEAELGLVKAATEAITKENFNVAQHLALK